MGHTIKDRGPVSYVSRFNLLGDSKEKPDLLELVVKLKPKAREVFLKIKSCMNPLNNVSIVEFTGITDGQRCVISKAMTAMVRANLIKRIKTYHKPNADHKLSKFSYKVIVNPHLIYPERQDKEVTHTVWASLP